MRREDVGLGLREDVKVIVIRLWNLGEQIRVGRGDGRRGGGDACEKRRGGRGRRGRDNGKRRGRRGRGGNAGGGTEFRGEGELARLPVDVGVMASQPREAQDELEMTQLHDVAGKVLSVDTLESKA